LLSFVPLSSPLSLTGLGKFEEFGVPLKWPPIEDAGEGI